MIRKILILLLLLSSFFSAFAKEKPILRWAADAESGAPFVFQDPRSPTTLIGFEVDIINAIAKEIGYDTKFVQNQWDGLIPGIDRGDYDIAINGLEITPEHKQAVNFSIPYYITYQQMVVRQGVDDINSLEDLKGKKAGTLGATLAEKILREADGIDVKTYESEVNSYEDLKNGRLDAVLIDQPVALYYASWNKDLKLVAGPIGEVVYGIVIKKGNDELKQKIDKAITKMKREGSLRQVYDSWNMWNELMAMYFDDHSESRVKPTNFTNFLEVQGIEMTTSDYINRYISFLPMLGEAAMMTVFLSVVSMIVAIILGLFLALIRIYAPRPFAGMASLFIEIIRGTPLLIQLFFIFYALPSIGIKFNPMMAAIIGLGLNYAAYEAELYRAGLLAVPRGQMEAAISLGMSRMQALRHIIVPQAVRIVVPPITNDFIALLKDSSLVSVITMVELTKVYGQLASTYYDYVGIGILVAVIYLLIGLPFVKLSKTVEKRFASGGLKVH
jgi:His/Glu/Gln/Arg/opine family amino acid ABC transporter permease subunit